MKTFFVFLAIVSTTWRAFNLGFNHYTYAIGSITNLYFIYDAKETSQKILNSFYFVTSLIGIYSYTFK
jgi:phosphate/sulfate permease